MINYGNKELGLKNCLFPVTLPTVFWSGLIFEFLYVKSPITEICRIFELQGNSLGWSFTVVFITGTFNALINDIIG